MTLQFGHYHIIITGSKSPFSTEVRRIRERYIVGSIEGIKEVDSITVNDVLLYPVLVKFKDEKCRNWMSLSETTAIDQTDWTPYLFVDDFTRRETLDWIGRPVLEYQTEPEFPEGYEAW